MNTTEQHGHIEVQLHLEAMCQHYGITDVFEVKAACIANEWARVELMNGEYQPFFATGLYEFVLQRATQNTGKLAEFVAYARSKRGSS